MSDILDALYDEIPEEETRLFELCDEIGDRIQAALTEKGWTQRQLAAALGKRESYVSRALAGGVNFTLRTIVQFEIALGVRLVPSHAQNEDTAPYYGPTVLQQPGVRVELFSTTARDRRVEPTERPPAANDYSFGLVA